MRASTAGLLGMLALACQTPGKDGQDGPGPQPTWAASWDAASPVFRRLTVTEYENAVQDLLGVEVVTAVEPDVVVNGMRSLGAGSSSISQRGVEQYEAAAFNAASSALADPELHASLVPCAPQATVDDACAAQFVEQFGRLAWRRPLEQAEVDRLTGIVHDAATVLGTFDDGVEYGIAAMLQSPNFLFRVEQGEVGTDGVRRYTSWEMATRLSLLLWDSVPDEALLDAAAADELTTDAGLSAAVERMLADPRARRYADDGGAADTHGGLAAFFDDAYLLYGLESLSKDPLVYEAMSATLGPAAHEQTLRDLEYWVFDTDNDFRDLFTTRITHLNRELASVYDVPAPARTGFARTELPEDGIRRGLLGQVSFLALLAHPTTTSPTRRGKYIREHILCEVIPAPPAGVNTSIPEPSGEAPTLRDRVAQHLQDPYCAGCHKLMDPVGLGYENFDGIGRWRAIENNTTIDASGDLDGNSFHDAWDLGKLIAEESHTPKCVVKQLFMYALGRQPTDADDEALDYLNETFAWSGYRVRHVLNELVMSPAFREVNELDMTVDDTDADTDGGTP